MRLFLLVLFTGCATTPTVYGQGMPIAPSAPAFNPAWDAPRTVGQPGYAGPMESLPRSPHQRVLPPKKEPGLWAGDQPQSVIQPWKDREPIVIGTVFPDPDDPLLRLQLRKCAYLADSVFTIKMRVEDLVAAPSDVRACLAALAYKHCAASDVADVEQIRESNVTPLMWRTIHETLKNADRAVGSACRDGRDTHPWVARWMGVLVREWPRFNPRGPQ